MNGSYDVVIVGTGAGGGTLARHLALRDLLRADPEVARGYGDLKRSLAAHLGNDRVAYTEGKTVFIESLLARRH